MSEAAIGLQNLGKMYKLYHRPVDKVLDVFGLSRWLFWRQHGYQEFWALRDWTLEIAKGERVGIIGRNGAGKSTLLKIIAGNMAPTEGTVKVNGRIQALLALGTGFHPEFTGRQNIRASLAYLGLVASEIAEKEDDIIDFAELDEFIEQPIKTYSAGMYARLAFSIATAIEPEILIIDEILGAGDAYFAGKCIERMKRLTEDSQATVLFVSHDVASVQRLCSRVIWMHKGTMLMAGEPHVVVKEYLAVVRRETEIRHRAQEMRISQRRAKMLMTSDDAYTTMLFRLRVDAMHPKQETLVYRMILSTGSEPVAHLEVGTPMDNDPAQRNYVIDDIANTDWTPPKMDDGRLVRGYADRGGKDGHAPFILSVPTYLLHAAEVLWLAITHRVTGGEKVYVEYYDAAAYRPLGTLMAAGQDHPCTTTFQVPLASNGTRSHEAQHRETDPADASSATRPRPAPGTLVDAGGATAENTPCRILGVDFVLKNSRSVRVVRRGSWLRVDLHYEALECVYDPVFAVTFHRLDGVQMDHQNSKLLGTNTGEIRGRGTASFLFDPLRLGVGEYVISAAILKYLDLDAWDDVPPAYDWHDRHYRLSVYTDAKDTGCIVQECAFALYQEDETKGSSVHAGN
jgi:lipopolysaccharide transport system ATP-binding protein